MIVVVERNIGGVCPKDKCRVMYRRSSALCLVAVGRQEYGTLFYFDVDVVGD